MASWTLGSTKHIRSNILVKQLHWLLSEGRLLRRACAVLFTTEEEKLLTRKAFWPYRVREHVIGYGTADVVGDPGRQMEAFYARVPSVAGKRFLLFLSRIHPKKGCDILIHAFARHARDFPDLDLVIAGPDQIGWRGGTRGSGAGGRHLRTDRLARHADRVRQREPIEPPRPSFCRLTPKILESS